MNPVDAFFPPVIYCACDVDERFPQTFTILCMEGKRNAKGLVGKGIIALHSVLDLCGRAVLCKGQRIQPVTITIFTDVNGNKYYNHILPSEDMKYK